MKFDKPLLITKLKATGIHMSLSLVVFVFLAYQIYFNWYPQPYFSVDGGWQGIRLVGAVDLVLGPVITFLIFNLRKSRRAIIFDLVTILVIQLGALAYGIHVTYTQRPVAVVLFDEFAVSAIAENYGNQLESLKQLEQYSDEKPPIIYARFPLTREALAEIQQRTIKKDVPMHAQLELYQPKPQFNKAIKAQQMLFLDRMETSGTTDRFNDWLQKNRKNREDVSVMRFSGRYGAVWLVFDLDGKYLSYF